MPEQIASQEKRRHWFWWSLLLLGLVAINIYYFLSRPSQSKNTEHRGPRAVPIETDVARKGDIRVYVRALGTVIPLHTVTAVSQVQGQILSTNFQEGQMVKKGDLLVKIDPRPFQAALLEAEGQLEKDTSLMKQAASNLVRYRKAYAARAIAEQQMTDQEKLVQQTRATVKTDQGVLANAKVNLAYCDILSPIDGQVGLRLIDPGNLVQANGASQLVVITQMEPITVIFSVAEDYLSQIQNQLVQKNVMPVEAYDRTQQRKISTGTFLAMDNQIDPTTGTVRIRAIFDNKDHALFPNQFVNAKLLVNTRHDVILLPTAAVQIGPKGSFVYVITSENIAKVQAVKVETTEGDHVAVQGVNQGQMVAVSGFDKLQDGISVIIRNPSEIPKGHPITRN